MVPRGNRGVHKWSCTRELKDAKSGRFRGLVVAVSEATVEGRMLIGCAVSSKEAMSVYAMKRSRLASAEIENVVVASLASERIEPSAPCFLLSQNSIFY